MGRMILALFAIFSAFSGCSKLGDPLKPNNSINDINDDTLIGTAECLEDKGEYCLLGGDIILDKRNLRHRAFIKFLNDTSLINNNPNSTTLGKAESFWADNGVWPNNTVLYNITGFTASEELKIRLAMDSLSLVCGVKWRHSQDLTYCYDIHKDNTIMGQGNSTLGPEMYSRCHLKEGFSWGTATHEFMHGLGFLHEHQRQDRPILIIWDNIPDEWKSQYDAIPDDPWFAIGDNYRIGIYDYLSIMHYPSILNGKNVIRVVDNAELTGQLGQRRYISNGDLAGLRNKYGNSSILFASMDVFASNGAKLFPKRCATLQGGFWDTQKWFSGDFNGDWKDDLAMVFNSGNNTASSYVYLSNGINYSQPQSWLDANGGYWDTQKWFSGDFNGDGRDDLAMVFNAGNNLASCYVYLSNGTSFGNPVGWFSANGGYWDTQKWFSGDFNGDGRDDLAMVFNTGNNLASSYVYLSNGTSFSNPVGWFSANGGYWDTQKWFSGDFNGDGRDDLAMVFNTGNNLVSSYVYLSNGTSFSNPVGWFSANGGYWDTQKWLSGDLNGDGKTDLAIVFNSGNNTASSYVYLSGGSKFNNPVSWLSASGGYWDSQKWLSGDFNADRKSDLVRVFGGCYRP